MPVTVPGIMGALIPNLVSVAMIGTGVPQYCKGVALGVTKWIPQVKVQTVDVGTAGAGKSAPTPIIVPQPLLYANVLLGMTSQGLAGVFMPVFAVGLTNGLVLSFIQMVISTNHPSVGTGGGVAKFSAPPAASAMIQGFKEAGLKGDGSIKKAKAVATALDKTFAILVLPVVIVGPPSPAPGAGSGFGSIV
jgi:hypothetical protein